MTFEKVADRLSKEKAISAVYSSDLKRAFETARQTDLELWRQGPGALHSENYQRQHLIYSHWKDHNYCIIERMELEKKRIIYGGRQRRAVKEEIVEANTSFEGFVMAVRLGRLLLCIEVLCFVVA
ncbi:hypothetical protein LWI28_001932 [Acer negundo]|uniref:Uncharacterized protein n=1 Tax=Acer negundo TaxID=4023 RepID=A0AAD5NHU9_ACENE|nr:hypothetical protein LWI28_001932 [Acer negundo]